MSWLPSKILVKRHCSFGGIDHAFSSPTLDFRLVGPTITRRMDISDQLKFNAAQNCVLCFLVLATGCASHGTKLTGDPSNELPVAEPVILDDHSLEQLLAEIREIQRDIQLLRLRIPSDLQNFYEEKHWAF